MEYYLIISIDVCLCLFWLFRRAQQQHRDARFALDLAFVVLVGGFFGARILHVFYEAPQLYIADPIRALEVWRGGFVWFGGVIGAAIAAWFWFHIRKDQPAREWMDFCAPVISAGYMLGRIGCWVNGCCYGEFFIPTQLAMVLGEAIVLAGILWLEKSKRLKTPGQLFWLWLIGHSVFRFVIEVFRTDPRGDIYLGLSISMVLSLGFIALSVISLFAGMRARV